MYVYRYVYLGGGSQFLMQMPGAECNVAVEPGFCAEMSSASQKPSCPPPVLKKDETLQ